MDRTLRVACLCLVFVALGLSWIASAQWIVSKDGSGTHRGIQSAIDAASPGDTIYVRPGVYDESLEFKNGISLIGSGAEVTIVRNGYGFDEVLHARNVSAGRIEGFTFRRLGSILPASVVVLESAAPTVADCVITGGQTSGLDIRGLSGTPTIDRCEIHGNGGNGVSIASGAAIRIDHSVIRDNGAAGILVEDSSVDLTSSELLSNGTSGVVLAGAALAALSDCRVSDHPQWGIDVHDDAAFSAADSELLDNDVGAVRLDEAASGILDRVTVARGGVGIRAEGASDVEVSNAIIRNAAATGIDVRDGAAARIDRTEISGAAGSAISISSSEACTIDHATAARNGGDGLVSTGTDLTVRNSVFALNDGAGIRVGPETAPDASLDFAYNAVWKNAGGDYHGLARRSSDIAASPAFVDAGDGAFALRSDSPLLSAGEWGTTIGAYPDPRLAAGTRVSILAEHAISGSRFRPGVAIALRMHPMSLDQGRVTLTADGPIGGARIDASVLGTTGRWLRASAFTAPWTAPLPGDAESLASVSGGVGAMLDGAASTWTVWGEGRVEGGAGHLRTRLEFERPTGLSLQSVVLEVGGLTLTARATNLTLHDLRFGGAADLPLDGRALRGSLELELVPQHALTAELRWPSERWGLAAELRTMLDDWTRGDASILWEDVDDEAQVRLSLGWSELLLDDAVVRMEKRFADLDLLASIEIGIHGEHGTRLRLSIEADATGWFARKPNQPPVAAFAHHPFEPETGEAITFDASDSEDPDGTLDQYWWDFGDGTLASGESAAHAFAEPGDHAVTLIVSDDDGATAERTQLVHVWAANTAPAAEFSWDPVSEGGTRIPRPLRAGDRIRLDATASSDPDGRIVEYAWDLESDGSFDIVSEKARVTVEPLDPGTWPVTLRVIDDTGRSDAIMRVITVESPKPPDAGFDISPSTPAVLDPVRFIDASVETDEEIVSWAWDFGDGSASAQVAPIHRYAEAGRYEARLTVTDAAGRTDAYLLPIVVRETPEVSRVGDVWALVIGIADYAEVEDLDFARNDAEAIAAWLVGSGISPDHIRLLTDRSLDADETHPVPSAPATLIAVREGLGWLRRVAAQDDLVLIHFSGHGYQGVDDGTDEPDGLDEFLILHDTRAASRDDTALRDDEFGRFLDRIASEHVLVLFDSCYSGGLSRSLPSGGRSTGVETDWFGDFGLEGRLVLSASSEGEEAFESPELQHGVFTHFLLRGLDGEADLNGDYHVTLWELYEYVARVVPPFAEAERGKPQHPQLLGEGETRILLAQRTRPLEVGLSVCPPVPYAGGPVGFDDASTPGDRAIDWTWELGDGTTASGPAPIHTYSEAGVYEVILTVVDDAGGEAVATASLFVREAGTVLQVDAESGTAVISLGSSNGVRVGDRFAVADSGTALVVDELLDEDHAACTILIEPSAISPGLPLRPIDVAPCAPRERSDVD